MSLLFVCYSVYSQNPSQIDILTTEDGLLFRDVSNITQDNKGLLWIGTTQGLNRYDGQNFKVYNSDVSNPFFIEDDYIKWNMVYDDATNSVWFSANDKLFQLQISTDSIISYNEKQHLNDRMLGLYKSPDNSIWVVTDDYWQVKKETSKLYLKRFENGKFNTISSVDRYKYVFNALSFDTKGSVWWSTTNGTNKYNSNGELLESYILDTYDWNGDLIHYVPNFFDSNNTHYYFPESKGGIYTYNALKKTSETLFETEKIIRRAIEDVDGNIWFAGDKTLYRMDKDRNFIDYTNLIKSKLDYSLINNLFIDKSGLLWVATDNGLFKVKTQKQLFSNLFKSTKEGWGNSMRGIFEDADGRIFSLCESKHQLWYKTKEGKIDSLPLKTKLGKPLTLMYDASFIVTNSSKTKAFTIGSGICEID